MARPLKLISLAMISIFLSATLFCDTSGAAIGNGTVKIGHITYAKGQVLVRSKGKWMRLKKTPWPLYATDRIVTKSGRASINLVDGGVVRMNIDTSLRIIRKEVPKGFLSSATTKATEVNVIVGNIWFQVELKKNKKMQFRTPSMTAAIRGTEGDFAVGLSGQTNLDLKEGKTANTGTYSTNPGTADTKDGTSLDASSSSFLDSRQMKAVGSSLAAQEQADSAKTKSSELNNKADTMNASITSETEKARAAQASIDAAIARSNAAEAAARAKLAAISEEITSAETLNDTDNVAAAQESLNQARRNLAIVIEHNQDVHSMAEGTDFAEGSSLTTILSALLTAMAYSTEAHSASVLAYTMAVLGHSAGNTEGAEIAESEAAMIVKDTTNVDELRSEISKMLQQVSAGMGSRTEQALITASQIASEAASVFAADAISHANSAVEAVCGDTASQSVADEASGLFVNLTGRAHLLVKDLALNVEAGNIELLEELLIDARELSDTAAELSGDGETPEVFPETPLIDEIKSTIEDNEAEQESETQPQANDVPVLDPTQDPGGTGDRNVSPYTF